MVHVIAEISLNDGVRDEFLREFHRLTPIVRDEDGCIEYGPTVDAAVDISAEARPSLVTIIEKWTSEAALRAHLQAPHMVEYRKRVGHLIQGVSIRVYQPA